MASSGSDRIIDVEFRMFDVYLGIVLYNTTTGAISVPEHGGAPIAQEDINMKVRTAICSLLRKANKTAILTAIDKMQIIVNLEPQPVMGGDITLGNILKSYKAARRIEVEITSPLKNMFVRVEGTVTIEEFCIGLRPTDQFVVLRAGLQSMTSNDLSKTKFTHKGIKFVDNSPMTAVARYTKMTLQASNN